MTANHTAGPWIIFETPNDPDFICEIAGIAAVYAGDENARADARVIAAAPYMLADLREAAATLRRYEALHRAKNTEDSAKKADVNAALAARFEATIAKATGGKTA